MAIIKTDDAHYKSIAAKIREKTGLETTYKPSEMVDGIEEVYEVGVYEEHTRCVEKHFATTIMGNGQTSISFHVPFEPDFISIVCNDPDIVAANPPLVNAVYFDLRSFSRMGGMCVVGRSTLVTNTATQSQDIWKRYSRADDGTITIKDIAGSYIGSFKANRPYLVCAIKYVEQTDKERITEYIRSLDGSGSTVINQAKVNAAFTDEEWAALIAEKPNWTFTLM